MQIINLVELIKTNNYKEFNLEREKFNYKEITFKNIKFKELKINNFDLINCIFDNCNLIDSKFDTCYLFNSKFDKCDLFNSKFDDCKLRHTKFDNCDLRNTKFNKCNLNNSKIDNCTLIDSKIDKCNINNSKFYKCNLTNSKFINYCNLALTKFIECNLSGTCINPNNIPNRITDEFEKDGDYIIGYRTKKSYIGKYTYENGKEYEVEIFSTSKDPCHPGLYLAPSIDNLYILGYNGPYVKVWAKAEDTHKAGDKYRTKKFYKVIDV